ncbi:Crp/Fnr family transcriptional regulator [Paenibacillus sp. NRS-1760]|uniref:Crp/Fnr family transcriptional regulator n=1 Tax=Paenibacillus sp. NRS-1760 TaxID=3233902 RepID=UPI003D28E64A
MQEIKDREQLHHFLQAHQLEATFGEQLLPHLSLFCFDHEELICSQGQSSKYLYFLVQGKIKIYTTSKDGKTLILTFKTSLDVVGDIEYVQDIDIINTVEAVSTVYMIGIHHQWLNKYGKDHSPLLQFLLKIIARKFLKNSNALSFNILHPVEVRLASYLLSVSYDDSEYLIKGQRKTISLKDTANLIGTSYRHLNRVVQQFCAKGLIERKNGGILVKNKDGLRALASQNIYE